MPEVNIYKYQTSLQWGVLIEECNGRLKFSLQILPDVFNMVVCLSYISEHPECRRQLRITSWY